MSVIAVDNIPLTFNLRKAAAFIAVRVKGHIVPLGFDEMKKKKEYQLAYLQLSEHMDPMYAIDVIRQMTFDHRKNLNAYVANTLPPGLGLPMSALKSPPKSAKQKKKANKAKKLPVYQSVLSAHRELLMELQRKYTALQSLHEKSGNLLLEKISKTIMERLVKLIASKQHPDPFVLTRSYRNIHPHFGDFQMILTKLHEIEDAKGLPRSELVEAECTVVSKSANSDIFFPVKKMMHTANKYSDLVMNKVIEHINNLESDKAEGDSQEDVARKRIRQELKKVTPYIPLILNAIVTKHFQPARKADLVRISIYGEPAMPSKEVLREYLLRKTKMPASTMLRRAKSAFNLLKLTAIPSAMFPNFVQLDGTYLGDSKLVVRKSDVPVFRMSKEVKGMMLKAYGLEPTEPVEMMDEDDEGDDEEQY